MKPGFLAPAGTLDRKPPHGQPCNRCGLCCVATLCPLGKMTFGRELGPCPALRYDVAGLSSCGLVEEPARYAMGRTFLHGVETMRRAALKLVGAATGCDARFNGEPPDYAFYDRLRQIDHQTRGETRAARKVWGI